MLELLPPIRSGLIPSPDLFFLARLDNPPDLGCSRSVHFGSSFLSDPFFLISLVKSTPKDDGPEAPPREHRERSARELVHRKG